jgi:hypothetical protein
LHVRLAGLHRGIEQRHLTAAALHGTHAARLASWASGADPQAVRPRFVAAVAEILDARAVGLSLLGTDRTEKAVVASSSVATAAQEVEFTFGEGPAHDASSSRELVITTKEALPARWAHYSPAVTRLGVRVVDAAPLIVDETCFGVLTVFDPAETGVAARTKTLRRVTDALVYNEMAGFEALGLDESSLFADGDHRAVTHQAAGMITAQLGCSMADALALLRAKAFVGNEATDIVARRVLRRELTFD